MTRRLVVLLAALFFVCAGVTAATAQPRTHSPATSAKKPGKHPGRSVASKKKAAKVGTSRQRIRGPVRRAKATTGNATTRKPGVARTKKFQTSKQRSKRVAPPVKQTTRTALARRPSKPTASGSRQRGGRIQVASARPSHVKARTSRSGPTARRGTATGNAARPVRRVSARPAPGRYALRLKPNTGGKARRGPASVWVPPPLPVDPAAPRTLSFYNVHTHQSLTATFWRRGRFVQSELDRLNDFLRDSRDGSQVQMDPELFNVLWRVRHRLRSDAAYQVLSAYRSPQTNAWLASYSRGVAPDSLHMRGQAMDVILPGRTAGQVRAAARELGLGGVGYYPRSGFVHLDTGPQRYW